MSLADVKTINAVIPAKAGIQYCRFRQQHARPEAGFTLMEIIVTILVASVLAALMVQFMGTAMTRGGDPVAAVHTDAGTGALLEQIISDYVKLINSNSPGNALAVMEDRIENQGFYGNSVSASYIDFDAAGQEIAPSPGPTSNTLKIIVQSGGYAATTLLTRTRQAADDPVSKY